MILSNEKYNEVVRLCRERIGRAQLAGQSDAASLEVPMSVLQAVFNEVETMVAKESRSRLGGSTLLRLWASGTPLDGVARQHGLSRHALLSVMMAAVLDRKKVRARDLRRRMDELLPVLPPHRQRELPSFLEQADAEQALQDAVHRNVGLEFEMRLEQLLRRHRISFRTEDELRARGTSRTPDAVLLSPIVIQRDGELHEVHWIDSKAMFGSPAVHRRNAEQLMSYVHQFGPGLVVYWFGHVEAEALSVERGIQVLPWFPTAFFKLAIETGLGPVDATRLAPAVAGAATGGGKGGGI